MVGLRGTRAGCPQRGNLTSSKLGAAAPAVECLDAVGTWTFWRRRVRRMGTRTVVAVAEGPVTRLGQLVLAGEVVDDEPIMPSTLRMMDAWMLSVVLDGEGRYR